MSGVVFKRQDRISYILLTGLRYIEILTKAELTRMYFNVHITG